MNNINSEPLDQAVRTEQALKGLIQSEPPVSFSAEDPFHDIPKDALAEHGFGRKTEQLAVGETDDGEIIHGTETHYFKLSPEVAEFMRSATEKEAANKANRISRVLSKFRK